MAQPGSIDYIRLVLTLTFMVGIIQLVMGVVKLGTLVNFISHSVVIGFTAGAAILIIASQVKHFFGLDIPRGLHFYEAIGYLFKHFENINLYVTFTAHCSGNGIRWSRINPDKPVFLIYYIYNGIKSIIPEI